MKIAVVGATGLVGRVMVKLLEERKFPLDDLIPVASKNSIGQSIIFKDKRYSIVSIEEAVKIKPDIALFSAGGSTSLEWAPKFAENGTKVIDNSSAWRMDPNKKLIVPEINADALEKDDMIIANPNCSTIQMVVAIGPLHNKYNIKRLVISTYQSVSGTGKNAVDQLKKEANKDGAEKVYPHQIYQNLLPHCDVFEEGGYTKEEIKLINETRKKSIAAFEKKLGIRLVQNTRALYWDETKKIRVGSGGVMLGHYSPLKIAETFSVLESLYPGRIDLGIGRAPGSDQLTAAALAYGSEIGVEYFPTRVADLMAFLGNGEPPTKVFKRIKIVPKPNKPPQIWMLGSSDQSALMAAQFGLAFSFAHFIVQEGGKGVLQDYRQRFQKSDFYEQPNTSLCIFIVCAKTEKDARKLALCRDFSLLLRERGKIGPFPSIKEAEAYDYTDLDQSIIERNRPKSLYGDPNQCRKLIETISTEYGVNEVVILSICHDPDTRRKSYELIADAFN